MHEITLPSGAIVSVSAANKKQIANAEILFGKNAKLIVKKIDELVKIKELDTSKLSAVLDLLNDADATTAFAKKAAGKSLVTAMKNLYKAKTLVAVINGIRAIKMKPVAIQQNAPAKTTRPVRSNTVDANGKIERNKWYVIDHTRHANDIIIKGPFKTEDEAEANVETGKNKRVIIQEAMTGQNCLDEGLTWTQNPDQKQTGGTPGAKTPRSPHKDMQYTEMYKMIAVEDNDEPERGNFYGSKLFNKLGLKIKSKDIDIGRSSFGGDENALIIIDYKAGLSYAFGRSTDFVDYLAPFKGKGTYTIITWRSPRGELLTELPKSSVKQVGTYKTHAEFYAALMKVFKKFAK